MINRIVEEILSIDTCTFALIKLENETAFHLFAYTDQLPQKDKFKEYVNDAQNYIKSKYSNNF